MDDDLSSFLFRFALLAAMFVLALLIEYLAHYATLTTGRPLRVPRFAYGSFPTFQLLRRMSVIGGKADMARTCQCVRL